MSPIACSRAVPIVAVQLGHLLRGDAINEPVVVVAGLEYIARISPFCGFIACHALGEEILVDALLQLNPR